MLPVEPTLSIKVILNISAGITVTVAFLFHLPAVCFAPEAWTLACIEAAQATTQPQHIPMLLETIPCYCQFVSSSICEEYSSWPYAHEHKSAPPISLSDYLMQCAVIHRFPHLSPASVALSFPSHPLMISLLSLPIWPLSEGISWGQDYIKSCY